MARGYMQRRILTLLNDERHRGKWWDTRHIANALFPDYADRSEVGRTRQALNRLVDAGEVERSGILLEWRSTRYPEVEPPAMLQRVVETIRTEHPEAWDSIATLATDEPSR